MKICWIDVETTGLNPVLQDVIQVAGLIELDGEVVEEFEFKCQPFSWDNIQDAALKVHGYDVSTLRDFEDPCIVRSKMEKILSNYVNKFDREDKYYFAGYNAPFDQGFMNHFWKKAGDKYFNSYFQYKTYDIFPLFMVYAEALKLPVPNHKLVTAAKHFGIEINAHDALSDIRATREVAQCIKHEIIEGRTVVEMIAKEIAEREAQDA
jgi:DNA polymerase-3 subunit epsilon